MALDITTQDLIIDETPGLQDDDINPSTSPHDVNTTLQYMLTRDGAGGLSSPEVAYQSNFVVASASAGETITTVILTQSASGTPFSTTVGVNSNIRTVDGNYVWLFQDPTHTNVVIGVIGTSNPLTAPAATGPLAFSLGLVGTSTTNADLYTVQYVPLFHPIATDADDRIDLTNKVFASVTGTSDISFTGDNAHSGSNQFNLLSSPDDASKQLLVTGLVRSSQADPNSALVNSECNVSEQGFGVDNQSINPDTDGQNQPKGHEVLQVDFVTGGTPSAGDGADIAYGSHLDNILQAGFIINQITPSTPTDRVDIKISAFDVQGNEQGSNFFDGSPTNPVDITSLTLTGASALATITADGTYATASGNVTVTGLSGTGNVVTITGLDNITTVDFTTSSQMDRLHVEAIDATEGLDITEIHYAQQTTNAFNKEVGSFINFDDDGPAITAVGTAPQVIVDESDLATNATGNFATAFAPTPGADGATIAYALGINALNNVSGLTDTATGQSVLLFKEGTSVVGRAGAGGPIVFTVSVDANGVVTLDQQRAIVHANTSNPDDSRTLAAADLVTLTATITDRDGDPASAIRNIGQNLNFEDDGPTINANGTAPQVTVDETDLATNATGNFVAAFNSTPGADGANTTYALGVNLNTNVSGLTDTETGASVLLFKEGSNVVGRAGVGGPVVFTVSVSALGVVTLDQARAVVHANTSNPDDSRTLAAADLVTLTATITDGDGDTASAIRNIGQNLNFEDDGPTITVPFDGDPIAANIQHEILANALNASASGVFGYNIGADVHPAAFYTGGGSDFVDQDGGTAGVQIGLTGAITGGGGGNLLSSSVTLASESLTSATFNFTFTYDKDPAAGTQTGTAGGTLVFDKVADTYAINLTDPLEGFSFDVLHTSELLAKNPTSNTGHPPIVLETLQVDDPKTDPNEGFYVQFTGNLVNKANPFGLTSDGEGTTSPLDTTFTVGGHDMVSNNNETWVSATRSTNGVAGDTIQKDELLTLRFFNTNVGITTEATDPTATAGAMAIKFDGIGNSEDLMLILNLTDGNGHEITRAMYVSNEDIYKTGQVPAPYSSEFTLDNNDGLVIVEQNDYNAAGENYVLQGVQIMQSANGITGINAAIDLNRLTGATGGSNATTNLVNFDPTDNDVLKITDIGFTSTVTQTPDANLDFAFRVADADGDQTEIQHILVDVT
ncbi:MULTISPECIES: DUF5801 repeats-in-toxin domain-containing protein [Rhizobium]|uniref:DUF5801 repeats-in-toxin domain-containing protein n=1 Tax=Rhizobium TaxID=379 RepID=UPI0007EBCDC7|nr:MULTISPECIES: DUF5801 repeats-in-toxin domain-containing protein [Rhizobium]ANK89894.1 hypothetical protein AMK01_CH00372 [Rhizobium sp. N6212]ANK95921.1 hypothetical protein AMK00_CH00372 [Rhizobium sp. N621]ANL01949.1 hypothetical protein AMJ99_CH00348 [Rhizobium esperanzae]ANL08077.1 hypothetical protein AMJ98_CH00348 [Rhizobium sp. N1341]ANL20123.1 hypothetical protein AMJ96_CH00349 [Rhizobium sp. N113]